MHELGLGCFELTPFVPAPAPPPHPKTVTSGFKSKYGNVHNAVPSASEWLSKQQWLMSWWLRPLFNYCLYHKSGMTVLVEFGLNDRNVCLKVFIKAFIHFNILNLCSVTQRQNSCTKKKKCKSLLIHWKKDFEGSCHFRIAPSITSLFLCKHCLCKQAWFWMISASFNQSLHKPSAGCLPCLLSPWC